MNVQHAFHCVITFAGRNWRIVEIVDGVIMVLERKGEVIFVDTSRIQWSEYCDKAANHRFSKAA